VNSRNIIIAILAALSVSIALADDFKTINGKEYKNVAVGRVEPDGLVVWSNSAIVKVYFSELPKEVMDKWLPRAEKERVGMALPVLTHLSAVAQTCPDNVSHITGTWTVLSYQMPINPISANLLPNGKVMIVAGSEHDASNNSEGAESYRGAVWDPSGTDETSISVHNLTYDVFCSGTAALFDGRSLIVGGTSDYTFTGENRASIFNPVTSQYVQSQNMVAGRWYGTATELADGRIMAMSGLTQTGGTSQTIEIYDLQLAGAGWNPPTSVPFTPPAFPKASPATRWKSVFYRTRQ